METLVTGIVVAAGLAKLVTRLLDLWKCSVSVDARAAPVAIEKNCKATPGTVVVVAPDSVRTTLQQPSAEQVQGILDKFATRK